MIERIFIKQAIKKNQLQTYLKKELDGAGLTHLDIVKTPLVTRIVLNVTSPGLAIGKGGKNIRRLTEEIGEKFEFENPQIEIKEIETPELNAVAMVDKMKALIERGFRWRSVAFRSVKDIQTAGAEGIELVLSGKLAGKGGRKRKHRIAVGYMKKVGAQTELVDFAKASAYPKAGAIGIKLRIIRPGVIFPDKVNIEEIMMIQKEKEDEKKKEDKAEEKKAEEAKEIKKEDKGKKEIKEEKKKEADVKKAEEKKPAKKEVKEENEKKEEKKEETPAKAEKPKEEKKTGKSEAKKEEKKTVKESKTKGKEPKKKEEKAEEKK